MRIDRQDYDVCVIGAGVAGALIAYRLGQAGAKVVVLEAGPRHSLAQRHAYMQRYLRQDDPWQSDNPLRDRYTNGGAVEYPLDQLRVKAVGGTTLHWAGLTPRLHESDFSMRSRYGIGADWPISYSELEPYYSEAEAELGVAGADDNPFGPPRSKPYPLPGFPAGYYERKLQQACDPLGIRFHTLPQARTSVGYRGRPACLTFSTCHVCPIRAKYSADVHVELAEATGNVVVVPHANVVRLEVDQHRRVTRAIYALPDKSQHQVKARIFIVAAHAVETARLLLLSNSPIDPDGLANGNGLVGKYFMDHIIYRQRGWVDESLFPYRHGFETIYSEQFYEKAERDCEPAFIIESHASGPQPHHIARKVINSSGNWGADLERELQDALEQEFGKQFTLGIHIEPLPIEANRIELDAEVKDYFGNPCPRIIYHITEYERAAFRRANQLIDDISEALGARRLGEPESDFAAHQCGVCRMGNAPETSVVDRNLRVHDVKNLYLVGSAVFPTIGAVPPTLTIAALALRLADHLLAMR